jgi:NADP-dependent 3-hydroxy acid dehydrogenase YdfG
VNTWGADSAEILLQPDDVADIVGNILAVPGRVEFGELSIRAVR